MKQRTFKILRSFLAVYFFTIYPVTYLFSENALFIEVKQLFIPLIILMIIDIFFFISIYSLLIITKNHRFHLEKTIILTSIIVLFLFTFGFIQNALINVGVLGIISSGISIITIGISIFTLFFLHIKRSSNIHYWSFCIFFIVLNAFPIFKIGYLKLLNRDNNKQVIEKSDMVFKTSNKVDIAESPTIVLLVLDMYPSDAILKSEFNIENNTLTKYLTDNGFKYFANSKSNYSRTILSLNSILNLKMLNHENMNELSYNFLDSSLQDNFAANYLIKKGYEYFVFEGGYFTNSKSSLLGDRKHFIPFEKSLTELNLQTTPDNDFLLLVLNFSFLKYFSYKLNKIATSIYRKRVLNVFNQLPKIINQTEKRFIVAHVMSPHPPYVFGENGLQVYFDDSSLEKKKHFVNQLTYLNTLVINSISKIMSLKSNIVFIILGDHGTRTIKVNEKFYDSSRWVKESFSNLNAIYFSDSNLLKKFKYTSTVNTFRNTLNLVFKDSLNLYEKELYYTDFLFPLKFNKIKTVKNE